MPFITRYSLSLSCAILLLAGCAGGGGSAPAQQSASTSRVVSDSARSGTGWLSDEAKSSIPKAYVSNYTYNTIDIYNANKLGPPIGTISNGISQPLGSYIDTAGTLYVTNENTSSVTVYPKGATSPSKTYTSGLQYPIDVVVGNDGTVYVAEYTAGKVVEYDKGMLTPSRTLVLYDVQGISLDSSNNLYVSYNSFTTGQGAVDEFAPKATSGRDLGLFDVVNAGDIKIDKSNGILLCDLSKNVVNFYKHGVTHTYGTLTVNGDAANIALNATESLIYVATGFNTVNIFEAKPNGKRVGTISGSYAPLGVSLSPPPPFHV